MTGLLTTVPTTSFERVAAPVALVEGREAVIRIARIDAAAPFARLRSRLAGRPRLFAIAQTVLSLPAQNPLADPDLEALRQATVASLLAGRAAA